MTRCNGIFGRKSSLTRIFFHIPCGNTPVPDAGPSSQTAHAPQSTYLWLALVALLALTAGVRLPGITRPLLGNFATKNVMYAMIARNWAEGRAGILYPTLDCMVGGERSLHMLEFPVSAYLTGGLWRLFGGSLDVWGRGTAVGFSVASVAVLFLLVRRWHGPTAALGAACVLALSPVSIIYGHVLRPRSVAGRQTLRVAPRGVPMLRAVAADEDLHGRSAPAAGRDGSLAGTLRRKDIDRRTRRVAGVSQSEPPAAGSSEVAPLHHTHPRRSLGSGSLASKSGRGPRGCHLGRAAGRVVVRSRAANRRPR
jgi:hypothetical protein